MANELKIYSQNVIEDQPIDSSAVTVIDSTGSTSSASSAPKGTKLSVSSSIRPRPIPVPVVAKELIGSSLNTQSRQILGNYSFGKAGSMQIGEYVSGVSGDLRLTPDGITARNSGGVTTFAIDGVTGDATFLGTIAAGSVITTTIAANQITGTILDAQIANLSWAKITDVSIDNADIINLSADKITTGTLSSIDIRIGSGNDVFKADSNGIYLGHSSFGSAPFTVDMDGNLVATSVTVTGAVTTQSGSNLNLDYVTAGTLTAGTISGITITGGTVRTSSGGTRIQLSSVSNSLDIYSGGVLIGGLEPSSGTITADGFWFFLDSVEFLSQVIFDDVLIAGNVNGSFNMNGNSITSVNQISGGSGNIDFNETGRIQVSNHFDPSSAGNRNLGGSSRYWNEINYKTLNDRGCLGWFDDGVEILEDGKVKVVSDLEAIRRVKKHPTKMTVYGKPMLDYTTLPIAVYKPAADHDGNLYERDPKTNEPLPFKEKRMVKDSKGIEKEVETEHQPVDGAETTALISIMFGAIKELTDKVDALNALVDKNK